MLVSSEGSVEFEIMASTFRASRKRLPIGTFSILYKSIRPCKSVCLCSEKKKIAPSGRGKQTTYKCKQCDLPLCHVGWFLECGAVKCGGTKLGE